MVESSGLLMSRNNRLDVACVDFNGATATVMMATGTPRSGMLETRVRGAWYRVTVTLESDYLSVSLDETCEPIDQTTTLNGTLGYVDILFMHLINFYLSSKICYHFTENATLLIS